ncbi:AAA domain-containing protein [Emticicia sp. 21SJ11W-3]|uniref:AAA domain-containing protein n=1 Tax=Emticicia sp. 21SJ11W-3 TaxID=2916755 RepID=UPI00209E1CEB|nr:AAA domain-containing protein [Emticicia sp. 21SJ11W-3]UTA67342.1 AAA domain-containing protein [Emticicia sp. 21SJ11W-3]
MNYFRKLLDLLRIEREEDHNQYIKQTEQSSAADRRAKGLCWYPIAIRGMEMSRGDYLTVEVERTTHQDIAHQLRTGMPAVLFSNYDAKNDKVEGTIAFQHNNRLKITLRTDELPDWSRDGKLGIDVLFDDNSYDEMQEALKQASAISEKQEGKLIDILIGEKPPTFQTEKPVFLGGNLNESQQSAVEKIWQANELAIVHGPPGTGKTTTLVQAIKALWQKDHKPILVVAPSNTAVDLLSEKLHLEGLNVLRVGNPARVTERLMALTLDSKMAEHSLMKEAKKLKKQAQEYKNMAHKYKRNFGKAERDQRKLLFDEAHKIMKEVGNSEQYMIDDIVARAQVITATLVGANNYTVKNLKYHTVVIDEAGQALEPACWIPILKAQKVILAGDHLQLPPTIKSNEAARGGLATTLLEKLVSLHPEAVVLLEEQYRMNEQIMGFSSKVFYENRLKANSTVANHLLFKNDFPVVFIDTAGCSFDEKLEGTSTTNPDEAVFVFKHLHALVAELKNQGYTPEKFPSVAVISPYKEQINLLQAQLESSPDLQDYRAKISVNTIDSFQGQERDIVYISMTRSNAEGSIGFLSDIRRMNVAMTRARKKLVIVGDSATLASFPFYADFIAYTEQLNTYQSAWEFMD